MNGQGWFMNGQGWFMSWLMNAPQVIAAETNVLLLS